MPITSSLSPVHSSSQSSLDERRNDRRAPLDVLANRFLDGHPYLCRVTDISRTGVRVERLHEPEVPVNYVGLQFQLPGSEEVVTASGEVVFNDDNTGAVGIRFTALPAGTVAAITRYLGA